MDKKKILLCIVVIFVAVPIFLIVTYSKKNTNTNDVNISDYEKAKQVEEFTKKEQGTEPKEEITTNESGYTGIFIKNKQALLKVMNADGMLSASNMINKAFEYIPTIHEDSKKLGESDISKYYDDNKDKINYTFGINDVETFKKFLSDLNFIGTQGKISESSIEEGSVKKGEFKVNEVRFNLILKSTIGKSQTFNIKFLIQENNQKDNRLIYWY